MFNKKHWLILASLMIAACSKQKSPAISPLSKPQQESPPTPKPGELVVAAAKGDLAAIQNLLAHGADINESAVSDDENSLTPLMAAILSDKPSAAQILLDHGASLRPSFMGYDAADFAEAMRMDELTDRMLNMRDN